MRIVHSDHNCIIHGVKYSNIISRLCAPVSRGTRPSVYGLDTARIVTHAAAAAANAVRVDRRTAARFLSWPLRFQRVNQKTSAHVRSRTHRNDQRICRLFPVSLEQRLAAIYRCFSVECPSFRGGRSERSSDPRCFPYVTLWHSANNLPMYRGIYKPYRVYHGPFMSPCHRRGCGRRRIDHLSRRCELPRHLTTTVVLNRFVTSLASCISKFTVITDTTPPASVFIIRLCINWFCLYCITVLFYAVFFYIINYFGAISVV